MTVAPVYLDHHATTPVDPRVVSVVLHAMTDAYGNANSIDHSFGEAAAVLVATAAENVAELVGASADDVRFTSGSTESIRLAVAHAVATRRGKTLRIALTRVEHKAVLDAVSAAGRLAPVDVTWIDVDGHARISQASFDSAISGGVDLVCVMAANNEVGTVYPVQEITAKAHAGNAAVLVDATQAAGRIPLAVQEWGVDYLALSAHKMYGPKGVGALVAPDARAEIQQLDIGHEGTPNVPGIAGFGEACRLRRIEMEQDEPRIAALRDRLEQMVQTLIPDIVVNGDRERRLSHNLHISVPGVPNDAVVGRLRQTVAISTGAACTRGTHAPSHVLRAMGLSEDVQDGALRIGLGKFNTWQQVEWAAKEISSAIESVRSILVREARQ